MDDSADTSRGEAGAVFQESWGVEENPKRAGLVLGGGTV